MSFDAIDSLFVAVPDLDAACRSYERLGLRSSAPGIGRRSLCIGSAPHAISVEFLTGAEGASPLDDAVRRAGAAGRGLFAIGLRVSDLAAVRRGLEARGVHVLSGYATTEAEPVAWLALHEEAGSDLVLVQRAPAVRNDRPAQALPLKRLDHLAAVAPDLAARTRFWSDVLGVAAAGEVTTPTMIIRQLRIGDAVLELLGPASLDSPLRQRPPGLVGMASWEVADLDAVIRQARDAGFNVPDAAPGVLPGTRITTIPGTELAGVNMQLLQYV